MGLFKKKPDPISDRARALNQEIAALEAQIKKLAEQESTAAASPFALPAPPAPAPVPPPAAIPSSPPASSSPQPRLRSTALPRGATIPAAVAPPQPIFEPVDEQRIQQATESFVPTPPPELGTRKFDWATLWQRLKNNFRGPATSNPKLVSYLAAGSIQGLRPLRYEKRVARNRFILLVAGLALALWGMIWIIARNR